MRYTLAQLLVLLMLIASVSCQKGLEHETIGNFFLKRPLMQLVSFEKWETVRCKDSTNEILEDVRLELDAKFKVDKALYLKNAETVKDSLNLSYFKSGFYDRLYDISPSLRNLKKYDARPDSILAYKYVCKTRVQDPIDGNKQTEGLFLVFLSPDKKTIVFSKRAEGALFTYYSTHSP